MSRYIDADALMRRWCGMKCGCERDECGREIEPCIVVMTIEEAPSIDICFCKECKWCDDAGKKRALICTNPYIDVDPNPNFFCGYGEREGE